MEWSISFGSGGPKSPPKTDQGAQRTHRTSRGAARSFHEANKMVSDAMMMLSDQCGSSAD